VRAGALRAFDAGATGVTLWNFWYCFDYYHPRGANPMGLDVLSELADLDAASRDELVFPLDPCWDPTDLVGAAHHHHSWPGQVPLAVGMGGDGHGAAVTFDLPANVIDPRGAGARAELTVTLEQYWAPEDRLELRWDGTWLADVEQELRPSQGHESYRLRCAVPGGLLHAGANRLELRLTRYHERIDPFVRLIDGELRLAPA
jgi:hypothetical protein